jgi:8-oxo-dGTP pyrophosphatase MutT (NUDIX family)
MKTASAAIISNKKILLVKRVKNTLLFPEHWVFPGGRPEDGELPEETVVREVKEETNLDFLPSEVFMIGTYTEREMYRFLGSWNGSVKLQEEELSDFGWFTYYQALQLKLGFDYQTAIDILYNRSLIE